MAPGHIRDSLLVVVGVLAAIGFSLTGPAPGRADDDGWVVSAYDFGLPSWAPPPLEPRDNPTTPDKVELGRRLFYDGRLARDGIRSCSVCHAQERAFSETWPFSWGVTGQRTARETMPLTNVGYMASLTWIDPAMERLEDQAHAPLFGTRPVEMGMAGLESFIVETLSADPIYRELFPKAFPETGGEITISAVTKALAAFQRTLVSFGSPYDQYRYEGGAGAISEAARRGEALFFGPRLQCGACHGGLHFTDSSRSATEPEGKSRYHNTGLYNVDGEGGYPAANIGVAQLTGDPADMGRFRTPTLRNVAVTAPYMHDGSIPTLEAVLAHYAAGGRTLVSGQANAGSGRDSPRKSPLLTGFELSEQEKADLIAFLQSLTDPGFLTNPRLGDPWK